MERVWVLETKKSRKRKIKKKKNDTKAFKIYDIDINRILVSKEEPYGLNKWVKCFIGYNDNDDIRPLCIKLSQMIGYVKCFESNKIMDFKISDNKLLKKYTQI